MTSREKYLKEVYSMSTRSKISFLKALLFELLEEDKLAQMSEVHKLILDFEYLEKENYYDENLYLTSNIKFNEIILKYKI